MTELDLIIDLHRNSERQGPGSRNETLRALEFTGFSKKTGLKVADIGCGTGGQTITIAQNIHGQITAVDLFPLFLEELNKESKRRGMHNKIETLAKSMEELSFDKESFDMIWSEAAIYNIGFEAGIKNWKDYIKPGGFLCVSEITWITNSRPKEIEDFWNSEYPDIDTASNKIKILEDNGYSLAGYFFLKQDSWTENYYKPLEARFPAFLKRHNHSEMAKKVVSDHKEEIELYQSYKDYYSYGFYIARKD